MSSLDDVRYRFEWDAQNFAGIYSGSTASRWFNRLFRKAVFIRYDVTMRESGDVHDKSIVDIGCGSGIYSIELARRGAGRVLGLDFSAPMLELARRSARDASVTTAEFVQDEFLAHDFKGETFDVSIAMGVFDYLSEPAPYLAKMAKITHGKILASFPASSLVRGTARRLRYRLTGRGDVYYYTRERVEDLVRRSGIKHHRFVTVSSSGGGLILVGDQS